MKDIQRFILENEEWNPSLKTHKKAYNDFVKYYNKLLNIMSKEEILDMLDGLINDIKDENHLLKDEKLEPID